MLREGNIRRIALALKLSPGEVLEFIAIRRKYINPLELTDEAIEYISGNQKLSELKNPNNPLVKFAPIGSSREFLKAWPSNVFRQLDACGKISL
jgi:hypothetical protein